jgi:hypothetical protein
VLDIAMTVARTKKREEYAFSQRFSVVVDSG